jgi:hypothetical protein
MSGTGRRDGGRRVSVRDSSCHRTP